jgi:restriction endonuclease S subunit
MQLGDLGRDGDIQFDSMMPFVMEKQFERFVAKGGDLVFRGRGAGIAVAAMPEVDRPIIVASPLMIIRPDHKQVDPDYLAWALTTEDARRHYAQFSSGSAIVGIGKRDLETLEIHLPALQTQHTLAKFKKLQEQEALLITRHQVVRAKLVEALISNSIHKEKAA